MSCLKISEGNILQVMAAEVVERAISSDVILWAVVGVAEDGGD